MQCNKNSNKAYILGLLQTTSEHIETFSETTDKNL